MRVRDVMEKEVVTLGSDDTLDLVDDLMRLGRIRHMPIVSRGQLVGLVSQRDLFRAAISSVLHFRAKAEREWLAKISVGEIMTTTLFTIGPDAPIADAIEIMVKKKIGCLPVVQGGSLVGLLSESDCLRHLAHTLRSATTAALPAQPAA